jgi:hypothetical protein
MRIILGICLGLAGGSLSPIFVSDPRLRLELKTANRHSITEELAECVNRHERDFVAKLAEGYPVAAELAGCANLGAGKTKEILQERTDALQEIEDELLPIMTEIVAHEDRILQVALAKIDLEPENMDRAHEILKFAFSGAMEFAIENFKWPLAEHFGAKVLETFLRHCEQEQDNVTTADRIIALREQLMGYTYRTYKLLHQCPSKFAGLEQMVEAYDAALMEIATNAFSSF